jgi:PAS domain S-box-containing protein
LEAAAYRRLLIRLLALPIAALALLAFTLAFGFRLVQRNARRVDRSDQVIAQANNLIKLMVDEETGLRGFLLTRDSTFLQPYQEANQHLEGEFASLFNLVRRDPEQTARLQRLQATSRAWRQSAEQAIALGPSVPNFNPQMLEHKRQMDELRRQADDFLSSETSLRASRSFSALRIDNLTLFGLIGLAIALGLLLAWEIRRLFHKLARTYDLQIKEVQRWGDECYTREQWLNTTLRSIGDGVIACNPDGKIVFMNGVAEQLTGWKEMEANGLPLTDVFNICNQLTHATVENPVERVRQSGKIVGLANHTLLVRKDRSEFPIDDALRPLWTKTRA